MSDSEYACAKKCNGTEGCKSMGFYAGTDGTKMCQLLDTYFKDISTKDKRKIIYEPGSSIYDQMLWPPKVEYEYVKVQKESLGILISLIDFLATVSLMIFIKCLKKSQKIYLAKFKTQTIELDDFTIEM